MSKKIANTDRIFKDEPDKHDYPAAQDYLELLFEPSKAEKIVKDLQEAQIVQKKSKDVFRASELSLLPMENKYVHENLQKIKAKEKLSPILLVRGVQKLIIADGYHRMCAAYYISEDLEIPCKLVGGI